MGVSFLDSGQGQPDKSKLDKFIAQLYEHSDQAFYRLALSTNFARSGVAPGTLGQTRGSADQTNTPLQGSIGGQSSSPSLNSPAADVYTAFVRGQNKRLSEEEARLIATTTLTESAKKNLDPRFVFAVMRIESSFNPRDHSGAGAQGLLQLMPVNVQELGLHDGYDIKQNIYGGVTLLAGHLRKYGAKYGITTKQTMIIALAGYNAGDGNVRKYGGVPPFKETQNYVVKVPNMYEKFFRELPSAGSQISHWTP